MNVLHIGNLFDNRANGISVVVPQYVREQSKYIDVSLLNVLDNKFDVGKSKCFIYKDLKKYGFNEILQKTGKPDLIVFHGLYFSRYIYLWFFFIRGKYPYIIVPHASLVAKGQEKHRIRKLIYHQIFSKFFIKNCKGVQFLTEEEKRQSINLGVEYKKIVMPNGITIPSKKYVVKRERGEIRLLYIGRYDVYHKGIDILLNAIEKNRKYIHNNNIRIKMYGCLNDGAGWVKDKVDEKKIADIVDVHNAVYGMDKERELLECDYFIQTSRLEGQPMGVLEAISYGVPVLLSEGTNMKQDIIKYKCGDIEATSEDGVERLFRFAVENLHRVEEMSLAALECARQYEWDTITKKTIEMYRKIVD